MASPAAPGPEPLRHLARHGIKGRQAVWGGRGQGRPVRSSDPSVSAAFQTFLREAPDHAQVWGDMVRGLANASALDGETSPLAYLAVLVALRLESGIRFHVQTAHRAGATREEGISAILIGLPAAGLVVTQAPPTALPA